MDMVCDITDLDDDNDGFNDDVDAFPMNSSEAIDTDETVLETMLILTMTTTL